MRWRTQFTGRNYGRRRTISQPPPLPADLFAPLPPPLTSAQLIRAALGAREPLTVEELVKATGKKADAVYQALRAEMARGLIVRRKLETIAGRPTYHFACSSAAFEPVTPLAVTDSAAGHLADDDESYLPQVARYLGQPGALRAAYQRVAERPYNNEGSKPWLMTYKRHTYFAVDEWSDPDAPDVWLEPPL